MRISDGHLGGKSLLLPFLGLDTKPELVSPCFRAALRILPLHLRQNGIMQCALLIRRLMPPHSCFHLSTPQHHAFRRRVCLFFFFAFRPTLAKAYPWRGDPHALLASNVAAENNPNKRACRAQLIYACRRRWGYETAWVSASVVPATPCPATVTARGQWRVQRLSEQREDRVPYCTTQHRHCCQMHPIRRLRGYCDAIGRFTFARNRRYMPAVLHVEKATLARFSPHRLGTELPY